MDPAAAYRRRWATLGVLAVSLVMIMLDNTILNVALPSLARSLEASERQLQWMVDAYILVFAGLMLTAGSTGDRFGRRTALAAGLAVFGSASAWAAWSGSPSELIAARGLMGLGGALIMPATLSIITNSFPNPKERAKALGIWAAVSGIGLVFGPTIGGWLLGHFWWGSVFLVNVPVAAAGIVAAVWLVPDTRDPAAPRIDLLGALLSTVGLVMLVWAIIEAPSRGWTSTPVLVGFGVGAVVLAAFVAWEMSVAEPMFDLRYFADARFSAASLSVALVIFALFGMIFFLSQYLQFVLGYTALQAGERMIPVGSLVLGAPLGVRLAERLGAKIVVGTGLGLSAVALWILSTTTIHSGYGHLAGVLVLLGFAVGIVMAPGTDAVMSALPKAKAGAGSAVTVTIRQVSGALGVAVLGSVLSSAYVGRLGATLPGRPVPEVAKDGIAGALAVAGRLPGESGTALGAAAREAFIHAMDTTLHVGCGVALAGAVLALIWLPARIHGESTEVETVPAGQAEPSPATPA